MDTTLFSEQKLKDIADEVSCGLTAFVNLDTGEYLSYTETGIYEIEFYDDDVDWQREVKETYENMLKWEHCAKIGPMESSDAFQVMEDFVYECIPEKDRERRALLGALSKSHPFGRFKAMINYSEYRAAWFKFRLERYLVYVKECLEDELASLALHK